MINKQLIDKRARLRKAAQDYQSTLSWYQENLDSPNAEQDCDEATAAFKREICHRETDIIADLLDEIDELHEYRKARIVPDGWIAVPAEPTGDMLARIKLSKVWTTEALTARYKDMLRAAPRAPQRSANESLNQLIAIESQLRLLPCPFCGSEAHFDSVSEQPMSNKRVYSCACTECSCELMNGQVRNYAGSGWYETKEAAAADWNSRTVVQGGAA